MNKEIKRQTNKIREILKSSAIIDDLSLLKIGFQLQQIESCINYHKNQVEKLTQENNDLEEKYIIRSEAYNRVLLENADLKDKINTYENPDDLTLMFMYCEEKAKDKIKELQSVIDKSIEFIELHNKNTGKLYYKYNNKYLLSEIKEELLEILNIL